MTFRNPLIALVPVLAFAFGCQGDPPVVKQVPQFTSAPVTAAREGTAYAYSVIVTGEPTPKVEATTLAGWLSFEEGVLAGTPAAADVGEHAVTLTAYNGAEPDAVQSFTVTVVAAEVPAAFTSTPNTAATEGQPYSYAVAASGNPAPAIVATSLPSWLAFEANVLSGTPGLEHGGEHQVTLTAQNGVGEDAVQTFTLTVTTVSVAPAFTASPTTTATEGQAYGFTVATSGVPAPTVTATVLPGWLTFDGTGLTGTPAYQEGGNHDVVLTAANGISPDATLAFTLTVTTVSTSPTFTSTAVTSATEGSAYSYTATATGIPAPTLVALGVGGTALPVWLSFDPGTGVLSGTPGAADVGAHDLVITAQNGISPDATQAFTVAVAQLQVPPGITSTPVTVAIEGQAYAYTLTATGVPAPTFAATLAGGGALPAWLSLDATSGLLSGTPGAGDPGSLQLVATATNGAQPDDTQSFTLNVASAAVIITSAAPTTAQLGSPYSYTVTTSGSPAPTLSASGQPSWLIFDGTATLSGTPGVAGTTATITLTASNGVSAPGTESFTITVAPLPPIALAGAPYFQDFGTQLPQGWTATGGVWEFGIPTTGASTVGPPSVVDGPLAATRLAANYPNNMNATLRTPDFDLTGVVAPRLQFVHWYRFEGSSTTTRYDGANLKLSTNGGQTWTQLDPASVTPAYTGALAAVNPMPGQLGWSGTAPGWQTVVVDLEANLGGRPLGLVALRFDAAADSAATFPGWFLDAVRIGAAADLPVPPTITSAAPQPLALISGQSFSNTVTATGSPAPVLSASGAQGAALPTWLTFDATTGLLSGVPAAADEGNHAVELTAANGAPPDAVQTFTLAVTAAQTLAGYIFDGNVRTPGTVHPDLTATDVDTGSGTFTFPAGNGGGAALSSTGFHDPANPNYFEFTVAATAGFQLRASELVFDHYRSGTGPAAFDVSLWVNGVETALAAGSGTIAPTTWATARIPLGGAELGPYTAPVTVRITGSGASSSAGTWRLDNVELRGLAGAYLEAPTIISTPPTTAAVGTPYSYSVTATGSPAPSLTTSGRPAWLTFDAATATLSGIPTEMNVGTSGTITVTATNAVAPAATQTFTITVAPPPAIVISDGSPLAEGFGTALPTGWAFTGEWEFGIPTTGLASVGPPTVHDGPLAATKLSGNYSNSTTSTLQTPVLDLTSVTAPRLTFVHWYNFEGLATGSRWDGGNLKLSTDGGATWSALDPTTVVPAYTGLLSGSSMSGQLAWSGILADYQPVTVDLAANLGGLPADKVVLRFMMAADSSTNRPGWYLDDVKVGAAADL